MRGPAWPIVMVQSKSPVASQTYGCAECGRRTVPAAIRRNDNWPHDRWCSPCVTKLVLCRLCLRWDRECQCLVVNDPDSIELPEFNSYNTTSDW